MSDSKVLTEVQFKHLIDKASQQMSGRKYFKLPLEVEKRAKVLAVLANLDGVTPDKLGDWLDKTVVRKEVPS